MKWVWLIAAILAGVAGPAVAQEWDPFAASSDATDEPRLEAEFGGLLYSRWNSDLRNDFNGEQLHELRNKALLRIDLTGTHKQRRWKLHLSGAARYEIYPDTGGTDADFAPELWEAYARWESDRWDLVAGQQIRRWGRGVPSVVDVLNPADFSEFVFIEDEFQKLPQPMLRWTHYGSSYELELVAIPFFRAARLPGNDSDWSPISIRDLEGAEEIPLVQAAVDENLSPGIVTTPADNFLHGDLGLRWTRYGSGFDLDLFVFYGYEDLPAPVFTPDFVTFLRAEQNRGRAPIETLRSLAFQEVAAFSPIFVQQPERQLMAAAALALPLEKVTARFELVGLSRQSAYTETLERIRVPSVQALVGVDALSGDRFIWSLSFLGNAFITDERLFLIERYNVSTVGLMRVRPGDIDLWIETRALWNMNLGDAYLGPSVLYDLASGLQLQAGVNVLLGTASTPLGQLDDNDYVWLRLRYAF